MAQTAPALHAGPGEHAVVDVPVAAIHPSPFNPRKHFDETALRELATDIERRGIEQPLLLRPRSGNDHAFEIVDGERRWRASKLARRSSVPAIVRALTDDQVREIQLITRLHQADLNPLEQCDAFTDLLRAHQQQFPADDYLVAIMAVARRVSADVATVAKRLRLATLIEPARKAFAEQLVNLGHATLLAALEPAAQEKALRWMFAPRWERPSAKTPVEELIEGARETAAHRAVRDGDSDAPELSPPVEPKGERELRRWIQENVALNLKKAPWDLTDATLLPAAGSCAVCPKRIGVNKPLFGDLLDLQESTCMDADCFGQKHKAFVQIQVSALRDAGARAVKLSHAHSTSAPKGKPPAEGKPDERVYRVGQFVPAKKNSCDAVVSGVFTDNPGEFDNAATKAGDTITVCVDPACTKHRKAYQARNHHGPAAGGYDPVAEAEKRKREALAVIEERRIRHGIAGQALDNVKGVTPALLKAVLLHLWPANGPMPANLKQSDVAGMNTGSALFARAMGASLLSPTLQPHAWNLQAYRKEFDHAIAALGADPAKLRKQFEPKKPKPGVCRYCGCTEKNACLLTPGLKADHEPCHWVEDTKTVCSAQSCIRAAIEEEIFDENIGKQLLAGNPGDRRPPKAKGKTHEVAPRKAEPRGRKAKKAGAGRK